MSPDQGPSKGQAQVVLDVLLYGKACREQHYQHMVLHRSFALPNITSALSVYRISF